MLMTQEARFAVMDWDYRQFSNLVVFLTGKEFDLTLSLYPQRMNHFQFFPICQFPLSMNDPH